MMWLALICALLVHGSPTLVEQMQAGERALQANDLDAAERGFRIVLGRTEQCGGARESRRRRKSPESGFRRKEELSRRYGGANNSAGDAGCLDNSVLHPSGAYNPRLLQFGPDKTKAPKTPRRAPGPTGDLPPPR